MKVFSAKVGSAKWNGASKHTGLAERHTEKQCLTERCMLELDYVHPSPSYSTYTRPTLWINNGNSGKVHNSCDWRHNRTTPCQSQSLIKLQNKNLRGSTERIFYSPGAHPVSKATVLKQWMTTAADNYLWVCFSCHLTLCLILAISKKLLTNFDINSWRGAVCDWLDFGGEWVGINVPINTL